MIQFSRIKIPYSALQGSQPTPSSNLSNLNHRMPLPLLLSGRHPTILTSTQLRCVHSYSYSCYCPLKCPPLPLCLTNPILPSCTNSDLSPPHSTPIKTVLISFTHNYLSHIGIFTSLTRKYFETVKINVTHCIAWSLLTM